MLKKNFQKLKNEISLNFSTKPPDDVADEGGNGRCLERSLERSREVCHFSSLHALLHDFCCIEKFCNYLFQRKA